MKKFSFFLIFLLALCIGFIAENFSPLWSLYCNLSIAYAPRYIAEVDYSASSVVNGGSININTASVSELCLLDGIGQEYAKRIIKYRQTTESFEVIEDIMKVPGIGEKKFLKIKDKISVK